jgi:hypothetical protein
MKKHRMLLLGLGVFALLGPSAREGRAETLTLTVFLNNVNIFSVTGGPQAVTANPAALNAALAGSGYTFSSLSGSSDFPGTTGPTGGYVSDAGNVSFTGGTGGTLKIVVSEAGFTAPASGGANTLTGAATAIYSGAANTSTQTYVGNFTDSGAINVNTPLIVQNSTGGVSNPHANTVFANVPPYLLTYTLTNTTTINLTPANASNPHANDVFTGKVSIVAITPEPASLIMMVTGMPLPLVVMGLLRRRRRAA